MRAASKRIAGSGGSPSRFEHPLPEIQNTPEPPKVWPRNAPSYFHVLAKPTGAICNLDCKYCFFLSKDALYPGSKFRMSDDVLEAYIRHAVTLASKYIARGVALEHTIQTNGILLDEEWCEFLRENNFLVGLSIDG